MPVPRIKICCIQRPAEAREAVLAGANALGLVSAMPSGPGVIDEATARGIAAQVPPPVATFLLTSAQRPAAIIAQQQRIGATAVQLCDAIDPSDDKALRRALPRTHLVQVIHVQGPAARAEAAAAAPHVDALLLDSGNPQAAVKELGGTGRVHDWAISRTIRDAVDVPVFLAGGLHAGNVAAAIAQVRPFGVDVCSGVRTNGMLDAEKVRAFVAAVQDTRSDA
ncbi:phosphoribosylanthranilate isomerase [Salisaeta longa]|uniref:phosphoribosylanthranilate isomerase n=1 Tax=Salisaeta longa TaxID=503170 RepID=UPI0003B768AF|nr:phosphoribosylanthranilate isomerase [Salisaeta longa]